MSRLETRDEFRERRAHELGLRNYSFAHDAVRQRIDDEYGYYGPWTTTKER